MKQKKICMLGGTAVGKTCLVRRFVHSLYSDKYHTTIGVKIEKKTVALASGELTLVLWDIYGDDELQKMRRSYLRGTNGYLLVVDGTRRETLEAAQRMHELATSELGTVPFVLVLNKADRVDQWDLDDAATSALERQSLLTIRTSALTGEGVDRAFGQLAQALGHSP